MQRERIKGRTLGKEEIDHKPGGGVCATRTKANLATHHPPLGSPWSWITAAEEADFCGEGLVTSLQPHSQVTMKASLIKFYYLTKTYQAHILRSASPKYFFPPFIDFAESQLLTFFFFFLTFLGPHRQHAEGPRLGAEMEPQLLAYTTATATWNPSLICDLHGSSQQHWILSPRRGARDGT